MDDEATIYLVDDDPMALQTLAALVRVVFNRVDTFPSATDFLHSYRDPGVACLVLDVAMPGMSGLELQRKLVQEKVFLPVVFLTGFASVTMAVDAMQLGAVDFLEKPVRQERLFDSIRRALDLDRQGRRRRARRRHAEDSLAALSDGERAVLEMVLEGKMNKQIATELGLSTRAVEDRRARLMKKMGVVSLPELVQLVTTR